MGSIYNKRKLKSRRRSLRKLQTPAERKLWAYLRNRRLNGFRFVRQYSVGWYILDFYCPKARLCVELDGSHHKRVDVSEYDNRRTAYLCIEVLE